MKYFDIPKYKPARLHAYARRFNWDNGYILLEQMIEGDNCALGTALMLYWLGKPHYFRQYKKLADVETSRDNYKFLRAIEKGVRAKRFQLHGIAFDPRREDCSFDVTYPEIAKVTEIPRYMMVYTTKDGIYPLEAEAPSPKKSAAKKKATKKKRTKKARTTKKRTTKKRS